jgi:Arc/MetJ-type ribon-helix-helix transcriptional regulator
MTLQVPVDIQQLLDAQLATGAFAAVDDVLREALHTLAERQGVAADLQASLADIDAGDVLPLDEGVAEIRQRHGWASP